MLHHPVFQPLEVVPVAAELELSTIAKDNHVAGAKIFIDDSEVVCHVVPDGALPRAKGLSPAQAIGIGDDGVSQSVTQCPETAGKKKGKHKPAGLAGFIGDQAKRREDQAKRRHDEGGPCGSGGEALRPGFLLRALLLETHALSDPASRDWVAGFTRRRWCRGFGDDL